MQDRISFIFQVYEYDYLSVQIFPYSGACVFLYSSPLGITWDVFLKFCVGTLSASIQVYNCGIVFLILLIIYRWELALELWSCEHLSESYFWSGRATMISYLFNLKNPLLCPSILIWSPRTSHNRLKMIEICNHYKIPKCNTAPYSHINILKKTNCNQLKGILKVCNSN